jgi:hypothetical protein
LSHFTPDLFVPDGESDSLKIRTKSREVLSTSTDSDVILIDLIKKEKPRDKKDASDVIVESRFMAKYWNLLMNLKISGNVLN